MNYYGHIQKRHLYLAPQTYHDMFSLLCTHYHPVIKSGFTYRCLEVLLYSAFPPVRNLQVLEHSSTHASF